MTKYENITAQVKQGNPFLLLMAVDRPLSAALWIFGSLFVLLSSPVWISWAVGISILQGFAFLAIFVILSALITSLARRRVELLLARRVAAQISERIAKRYNVEDNNDN